MMNQGPSRRNRYLLVLFSLVTAIGNLTAVAQVREAFVPPVIQPDGDASPEIVNGNQQLAMQGTYNEVRNRGNLITVWRGAGSNQVWMAINNGRAFTIGNTETYVNPTVAAYGPEDFMVFYTAPNGEINYTIVYANGTYIGHWLDIQYQSTNQAVSVVQMGAGSYDIYMVYRSSNSNQIWGTWYNDDDGEFTPATWIATGMGLSEPTVTLNPLSNRLFATVQGMNGNIWMTNTELGTNNWAPWMDQGIQTYQAPDIIAAPDGTMGVVGLNGRLDAEFALYNAYGDRTTDWALFVAWTWNVIHLAVASNNIFGLFNFDNKAVYQRLAGN